MAKWCRGWRWSMERINRACRRCNENLLHLAVARSKGLPSVSYRRGGGVNSVEEEGCKGKYKNEWTTVTSCGGGGQSGGCGRTHACIVFVSCVLISPHKYMMNYLFLDMEKHKRTTSFWTKEAACVQILIKFDQIHVDDIKINLNLTLYGRTTPYEPGQ